jgi:hypothetical protein
MNMKIGQLIIDENRINTFERKVQRSLHGPIKVNGEW